MKSDTIDEMQNLLFDLKKAHVSAYVFFAHLVNLFKSDNIDKKCKIEKITFFKYFFYLKKLNFLQVPK